MSQARCASTGCAWSAIAHNSDRLRDRRVGTGASAVLGPPSERAACRRRTRIEQSLASLKYARAIAPRHEKHEANISLALIRPAAPPIRSHVHEPVGWVQTVRAWTALALAKKFARLATTAAFARSRFPSCNRFIQVRYQRRGPLR